MYSLFKKPAPVIGRVSLLLLAVTAALVAGILNVSAAVSPYGWWRQGEKNTLITSFMEDSGPLNNPMYDNFNNSAFYLANVAMFTNCAAGGPLGPNKIFSAVSAKQHYAPNNNGGYYSMGITNLPGVGWASHTTWNIKTNRNWIMECWFLPVGNGTAKGDRDQAVILEMAGNNFSSASVPACTNWGPQFWLVASNETVNPSPTRQDGTVELMCFMMGPESSIPNPNTVGINSLYPSGVPYYKDTNGLSWSFQLGTNVVIQSPNRKKWVHMAVVRDDTAPLPPQCPPFYPGEVGTVTLYVDGVACGVTNSHRCYQPGIMQAPYNVEAVETTDRPSVGSNNAGTRNVGNNPVNPTTGLIDNGNTNSAWPLDFDAPGWRFPISSGQIAQSGNRQCNGFIDEIRFSTFANGAFTLSDMLLRSVPGPGIVQQPTDTVSYSGQPAIFQVVAAYDDAVSYQWWKVVGSATNGITGAGVVTKTNILMLPSGSYSSGDKFVCQLSNPEGTVFTTTNTVTTVANPSANVTAYQTAVQAESSLISYYPGDGDSATGTTLTDVKAGNNGTISGLTAFDGSTNRFAAGQGLTFNRSGGFQNITNVDSLGDDVNLGINTSFELANSNGTIEAVLYMDPAAARMPVALNFPHTLYGFSWLASANLHLNTGNSGSPLNNGANARCVFSADASGHLYYWASYFNTNNALDSVPLLWTVPGGTLGKTLHVAFTFNGGTNVTCYVNGQDLGTQDPVGPTNNIYGIGFGFPWHIGNATMTPFRVDPSSAGPPGQTILSEGIIPGIWYGSVDELAIYGEPLTASKIAQHAYKYRNGTAANAATVTMLTPSKTMYANSSQTFAVVAGGQAPYTYLWKTNGITVTGATLPSLTLKNIKATVSVTCTVQGAVGSPAVSSPCVVTITTPTPGSYADQVMSNAPTAFYRFNEASGSVLYDWAGTHDGAYSGAVVKNVAGPATGEGGIQVFGTNAPAALSQARVPFSADLMAQAPGNTNGEFTYEYWYKPTVANGYLQSTVSAWYRRGNNRAGVFSLWDAAKGFRTAAFGVYMCFSGRYNNINNYNQDGANTAAFSSSNVWHHVVYTWKPNGTASGHGTTGFSIKGQRTVYVDGLVNNLGGANDGYQPYTLNQGQWQPNHYGDFIIGGTADDNPSLIWAPANGVIGDVAVYNVALTAADVQSHYSAYYTAAVITNGPVGVTTNESYKNSITLTAVVGGNGNTYQWFKDGNPLSPTTNPDGTPHYPAVFNGVFDTQGVDAPILVISQVTPADNGSYVLIVYNQLNPGGQIGTVGVPVTVTADTTAPAVNNVVGLSQVLPNSPTALNKPCAVQIRFSKRMSAGSAANTANYTISGGVSVLAAYVANTPADDLFGGDGRTVTLQTSDLTPGQTYYVTNNNLVDQTFTGNALPANTVVSFKAPVAGNGLTWDYYANVPGGMGAFTSGQYNNGPIEYGSTPNFSQLLNSFPFSPQFETTIPTFDTIPVNLGGTPGTATGLGANPVFGTGIGTGDGVNYGVLISGWITPTNTDSYTFFMQNDDNAALYLSSDASPANAAMIAQGLGVASAFVEKVPGPGTTSDPVALVAGQSYYIELILYQAAGNDYARVAWRSATGPDSSIPAANLQPIPSSFLTSYQVVQPVISATKSGGNVTVSWTGGGVLLQSTNAAAPLNQWAPVPGNPYPASPYTTPASATQVYYRVAH